MSRSEILAALKPFFSVQELVCDHNFNRWGEAAWQFLDTDYLHALLVIRRDILKAPMTCNNAMMKQRGLRCNMCPLVRSKGTVYLSSHLLGKAGDFSVQGMPAEVARETIKSNAHLLPCNIRMEDEVTWLHIDVLPQYGVTAKVYEFKG